MNAGGAQRQGVETALLPANGCTLAEGGQEGSRGQGKALNSSEASRAKGTVVKRKLRCARCTLHTEWCAARGRVWQAGHLRSLYG